MCWEYEIYVAKYQLQKIDLFHQKKKRKESRSESVQSSHVYENIACIQINCISFHNYKKKEILFSYTLIEVIEHWTVEINS
jgi:hypothetical protein